MNDTPRLARISDRDGLLELSCFVRGGMPRSDDEEGLDVLEETDPAGLSSTFGSAGDSAMAAHKTIIPKDSDGVRRSDSSNIE
jgi:hypothetical protein